MTRLYIALAGLAAVMSWSNCHAEEPPAAGIMPFAEQNAVLHKQCGSCHSDKLNYGGLSVEHFNAARADPTLAAILVSKITNGYSPREVSAARGPESDAKLLGWIKIGAMTAGGPLPDAPTQLAFARALSAEAAGAEQWQSGAAEGVLTATILRQLPSTKFPGGRSDMYRLIVACKSATQEGEIKLAWANGVPEEGREITVIVDGQAPFKHKVEGGQKQGNGANGPGATVLYPATDISLPANRLTIRNVFPDETVDFPFDTLNPSIRRDLMACFGGH